MNATTKTETAEVGGVASNDVLGQASNAMFTLTIFDGFPFAEVTGNPKYNNQLELNNLLKRIVCVVNQFKENNLGTNNDEEQQCNHTKKE